MPTLFTAALVLLMSTLSHAADENTYLAFRDAMAYGRDAVFDTLVAASSRAGHWPETKEGTTVLHLAAHVGGRKAGAYVRALLAAGLSPNAVSRDRHDPVSPLGMAVRFDCPDCVIALLAAGADAAERGPDGETLLHGAGGQTIPLLIAAGLSPLARDRHGNLPLHRSWHPALLAAGVNVTNDAGLTALHTAALSDSLYRVDALLAAGADPSLRSKLDTHWRLSGISRAFGPGLEVPKGSTAYDLARMRYKASRWSTQTHEATMRRLAEVTPRRGWFRF